MYQSKLCLTVAVAVVLGCSSGYTPALAANFGQTEVSQEKFIAVAVPRTSGYYTLLVLEQISSQKPCWQESSSRPTRVDLLLSKFNFTGICGRSTDSNGYSIRAAGQDLGLDYQLSLQKQKSDLVLLGIPSRFSKGKVIELGHTGGIRSGLLKIMLKAGWRFTKRTYSGKTLGHIYFSRDSKVPTYQIATASSSRPTPAIGVSKTLVNTRDPLPTGTTVGNGLSYRVMVVTASAAQQAKIRAQQPSAFRTSHQGQSVMQVGTFGDRTKAELLKAELTRQGFKVLMVTKAAALSALDKTTSPAPGQPIIQRIAVPSKKVPVGNARGARGVYAAKGYLPTRLTLPPPPPATELNRLRTDGGR